MPPQPARRRRNELANRRRSLGYTQERLGEALRVSVDTIAAWERGSRTPLPRYRPLLAQVLQASVAEIDRMIDPDAAPISLNGHRVPRWLNHYQSLVHAAGWLGQVELVAVPGLLQTRAYAEVVERASELLLSDLAIGEVVDLRLARQAVLDREPEPLTLVVALAEGVLRQVIGSPGVMVEQCEHLAALAQRPNIEVRIVPAEGGRAISAVSSFELLTKPAEAEPFMVCTFDVGGARYHEDPDLVARFVSRFNHLLGSALPPAESLGRINEIRESHL